MNHIPYIKMPEPVFTGTPLEILESQIKMVQIDLIRPYDIKSRDHLYYALLNIINRFLSHNGQYVSRNKIFYLSSKYNKRKRKKLGIIQRPYKTWVIIDQRGNEVLEIDTKNILQKCQYVQK